MDVSRTEEVCNIHCNGILRSRGDAAAFKLRNPIHGPSCGVKLGSPPWAFSVVNGLCLRSVRLVLAVSVLTGECLR